jgi:hypothetical protein
VVLAAHGGGEVSPASSTAAVNEAAPATAVQNTSADNGTEAATSENEATDDASSNMADAELRASQDMQPPPAGAAENVTAVAAITPENMPALSQAVADALNAGAPKPWSANGRSGEVTVGEMRYYQGRPCRSFIYTVGGTPSPTEYACDGLDGVWRPDRRFQSRSAQ